MKNIVLLFTFTALCATLIRPQCSFAQTFIDGQMPDTFLAGRGGGVYSVAFSPDGQTLASGSGSGDSTIKLWDIVTGSLKATLKGHTRWIESVAFSPDGTTLASGSGDNTIKLWDVATGSLKATLEEHTDSIVSVAFSPDGTTLASGSGDNTVRLWNPTTGERIDLITGSSVLEGRDDSRDFINISNRNVISSVAFSPDGATLAVGEYTVFDIFSPWERDWLRTGGIFLQGVASGKFKFEETQSLYSTLDSYPFWVNEEYVTGLYPHIGEIYRSVSSVAFSPNGSTLACAVNRSSYVKLHPGTIDERTIALQTRIEMGSQRGETYINDDGELVIRESIIELRDVASGSLKATLNGHTGWIYSVAFSPDGQTLASGGRDNTVKLWDVTRQPKAPKATLSNHGGAVYSVAFSPDGTRLASGCGDGTVRLWTALPPANNDGVVNIADLVEVAQNFGQVGENNADINGDGIVNVVDLILVAVALGEVAAAPAAHTEVLSMLTAEEVAEWLIETKQLQTDDPTYLRGIRVIEQLLAALIPTQTTLLANYPNPFNPETWIPYQLTKAADVTFRIYTANGEIVRTIPLGNMPAGNYKSRSRAAYWDGKNEVGEPVASGLYFYTLTAGDFTATQKMVIMK